MIALTALCLSLGSELETVGMQKVVSSFDVSRVSRIEAVLKLAKQEGVAVGIEYVGREAFELITPTFSDTDFRDAIKTLIASVVWVPCSDR